MSNPLYRQIDEQIEQLRRSSIVARDQRVRKLYLDFPTLSQLDMQRRDYVSALFKAKAANPSEKSHLQVQIQQLDEEIAAFFKEHEIDPKILEIHYQCPLCHDTGTVSDQHGQRKCVCFKQRLLDAAYQSNQLACAREQTFEHFDLQVFSDDVLDERGTSIRSSMRKIMTYCEKYADHFPHNARINLLMTGKTGVGKTYLMNCIAARVLENNHNALILSSGRLFDQLRRYAFSQIDNIDDLLQVELLLIDDLGTEPLFNNITIEYLFMLFNERTRMGRPLVITTNMTPDQLCTRYTERIFSRIMDRSTTVALNVIGDDLRLKER